MPINLSRQAINLVATASTVQSASIPTAVFSDQGSLLIQRCRTVPLEAFLQSEKLPKSRIIDQVPELLRRRQRTRARRWQHRGHALAGRAGSALGQAYLREQAFDLAQAFADLDVVL